MATSIIMNILVMLQTVQTYFYQQKIGQEHQQDLYIDASLTDKKVINKMDKFYTDIVHSDTDNEYSY